VLTHAALTASTTASLARLGAAHGERFTLALPLHHVAGIQILLRSRACGTDAEVLQRPDSRAIAAATGDHLSLVPTQLSRLLDDGVDLSGWHTILLGGARARPELLERARAAGASVVTSYGMTETCGGCVYDGLPLDSIEVARRDDGRITVRGPVLFSAYLGNPDATSAAFDDDGWFVTGDLGTFTDGRLEVAGRADDVIVSGGENVSAEAVAEVLRGDPRILDVAVIGAPDPEWGEVVVALTVPRDPDDPPRLEDLSDRVRQVLPPTHAPRRLVLVDGLPRDGMGKLMDTRLRPLLSSDAAQPDTRCRPHP
jgi:O-succinylbenzoic acid--CoA ligase